MTKDEALRLALEVLADLGMKHYENTGEVLYKNTYTAIKAALEAKDEPWTQDDMAYRPNGLPQEFIKHEVELPEDWSEWVCPNPDEYFMKCCDCGLVHEVQYRVARYGEGDYCELVDDKDVQAQFRMRRRTQPNPEVKNEKPWVCECGECSYNACKCVFKAALEAKDEPVAWIWEKEDGYTSIETHSLDDEDMKNVGVKSIKPLYAKPQFIGLSEDEIFLISADCAASHQHTDIHFARAIEAKLKEKNQ